MNRRYFTLKEAQGLVVWLEEMFQALKTLRQKLSSLNDEIQKLETTITSNGGGAVGKKLTTHRSTLEKTTHLIEKNIRLIHDRGILVKSIEDGLVDFPSMREGHEIYLCWRVGEPEIQYWHEVDAGFAGREPL